MRKGFTLIELIVVIAIIAILAAIIAPNAFKAIEKASRSATLGDFRTIKTASMAFYADSGVWPITGCFKALLEEQASGTNCGPGTGGITGWDGPYIEQWPSRTRWGGVYNISSDDFMNWDSASAAIGSAGEGDEARYLTMNKTPVDVHKKLNAQIDGTAAGGNCTAAGAKCGQYRWDSEDNNTTTMLLTTDSTVMN